MQAKEYSDRSNLMEAIIKENWLRTIVRKYVSLLQEESYSVALKISKNLQVVLNATSSLILSTWKNSRLMITMEFKSYV